MRDQDSQQSLFESQNFMDMKSSQVMSKPRLDEYVNELCHKEVDPKKLKNAYKTK